jgi:hypothetical protein
MSVSSEVKLNGTTLNVRAVSFHKNKEFVKLVREKSVNRRDGIITISTKQINHNRTGRGEILT